MIRFSPNFRKLALVRFNTNLADVGDVEPAGDFSGRVGANP